MYLQALVSRASSKTNTEHFDWLEIIFLWILAQASMRSERGNTLDGNLRQAYSKLRKVFTSEDHIDLSSIAWTIDSASPLNLSQIYMRPNGRAF